MVTNSLSIETLSVVIIECFCRNFSRWWCGRSRRDRVGVTVGVRLAVVLIVNGLFASLVHWLERESVLRVTEINFKVKGVGQVQGNCRPQ